MRIQDSLPSSTNSEKLKSQGQMTNGINDPKETGKLHSKNIHTPYCLHCLRLCRTYLAETIILRVTSASFFLIMIKQKTNKHRKPES